MKVSGKDYQDYQQEVGMVCQDGAECHRRDGETTFGCSGTPGLRDCAIAIETDPDVSYDGKFL